MIATVLSRSARGGSYTSLLSYLQESVEPARVRVSGSILGPESAAYEMEAMARAYGSTRGPYHFVLSLAPDERLPDDRLLNIAAGASQRLAADGAAFVASIHDDGIGRCQHVHVALAPVNPETGKKITFGRDWLVLDRFSRETELSEGLRTERGLYEIRDGEIRRAPRADGVAALSARARDVATWTYEAPFQSWVGEEPSRALAAYLVRPDASWSGVHDTLARFGVRYERRRTGASLVTDDVTPAGRPVLRTAKAGHLGAFATLPKLERELGPFRAPERPMPAPTLTYRDNRTGRREAMRGIFGQQADDLTRRYDREREMIGAAQLLRKRRWTTQRKNEQTRMGEMAGEQTALAERLTAGGLAPRIAADVAATAYVLPRKQLSEQFARERAAIGRAPRMPLFRAWLHSQALANSEDGAGTTVVAGGSSAAMEATIRSAGVDGVTIVGVNEIAVRRALAIATIERVPVREAVLQPALPFDRTVLVRTLDALGISVAQVEDVGEISANDLIARHDRLSTLASRGGDVAFSDAANPLRHVIFRGLEDREVRNLRELGLTPALVLANPNDGMYTAILALDVEDLDERTVRQLAGNLARETGHPIDCGGPIAIAPGTKVVAVGPRQCDELARRYAAAAVAYTVGSDGPAVSQTQRWREEIGAPTVRNRITVQPEPPEISPQRDAGTPRPRARRGP